MYEAEHLPEYAYFITSGMASVVTSMEDGGTAEVAIIGSEGLVGALHPMGPGTVFTDSFVQIEGTALRIRLSDLRKLFRSTEQVRDRVLEFIQEQTGAVAQIAGCNRLHEAEERLARWLLMCQDKAHSDVLNFTQEFLGMMLGSRRTTVTIIAGALQRSGLIEYHRGRVKILDRESLIEAACDCCKITQQLNARFYAA